jgi:hypothetical protein
MLPAPGRLSVNRVRTGFCKYLKLVTDFYVTILNPAIKQVAGYG